MKATVVEVEFIGPFCKVADDGKYTKTFTKSDLINTNPPGHLDMFSVSPLTFSKGKNTVTATCSSGQTKTQDYHLASRKWESNSALNGFTLTINPSIMNKVNAALAKLPSGKIQLEEIAGKISGEKRDCCASGTYKAGGERYLEGEITLKIKSNEVKLWPGLAVPDFEHTFGPVLGTEVEVLANFGVYLEKGEVSAVVTAGKRTEQCKPEDCIYGSVTANLDFNISAKAQVISCVETYWTDKHCADVTIKPGEVGWGFNIGGRVNSKDACDGPNLTGSFKDLTFKASVGTLGLSHTFGPYTIIKGGTL